MSIFQNDINRSLQFLDSLRVDNSRSEYFEVYERSHSEHRVYNQSQYLLSILFKKLGKTNLLQAIRKKHSPDERDNDPRRRRNRASDRFCILEGNVENFYLAKKGAQNITMNWHCWVSTGLIEGNLRWQIYYGMDYPLVSIAKKGYWRWIRLIKREIFTLFTK